MKSFTRFFSIILFSFLLPLLFSGNVYAVTLSPNSGTRQANATDTISIYANPLNGEDLVRLDLTFVNATVLDFDPNFDVFEAAVGPECSNAQTFDSTHVCVSLISAQAIPNNALIGTVSVRWGTSGTATVTAGLNNLYRLEPDNRIDSGLKATYTLGSIPATPLLETKQQEYLFIATGALMLIIGLYLRRQATKNETSN